ncbi:hypothetical protein, partial [Heyndrickxia coagulans]|uniref:hypothetical protein n=1 Tax=Heyndrickxia coagulans TaxID=1398 RepID=UPI003D2FDC1B
NQILACIRLVTKPCQNIRPASSNYLNYYIFSRIFGGGIVKLSRKIFTPQSWKNFMIFPLRICLAYLP